MNSTSFTDSSSTAHLTLNAALSRPSNSNSNSNLNSARASSNSDSELEPDRSPSVTVISSSSGPNSNSTHHHHLHQHLHNPLARPTVQLITGGFSLSNRIHLTKHQRTIWSRATSLEKLLMLAVIILSTSTILLFISLVSVFMSQKQQQHLNNNNNQTGNLEDGQESDRAKIQHRNYCLTPDCVKVAASVIEAIDQTVNPCDDFYVSFHCLV